MNKKRSVRAVLALVLSFFVLFSSAASAAVMTFETQFDHEQADIAWLTDLKVKEDVSVSSALSDSIGTLAGGAVLLPLADYPYTETPESLASDVEKYCRLYDLNENTPRAAYIFLFQFLGAASGAFDSQISDEGLKTYLENAGIRFPDAPETEDFVVGRALYTAMMTGSLDTALQAQLADGVSLQKAAISYLTSFSGMREEELRRFAPNGTLASLNDYVNAAAAFSLWTNGYSVEALSDPAELYRQTAVMTVEKLGLSVDKEISFEELNAKYTAALLGKQYGVTVDPARLTAARAVGNAAFYVLQLIGKKAGLTVHAEGNTLESAFQLVAGNSDAFDLEAGEFYADITSYEVRLAHRRDAIWICPEPFLSGDNANVSVTAGSTALRPGLYTRVPLNSGASEQMVPITVSAASNGKRSTVTYELRVVQGADAAPAAPVENAGAPTADTVVSLILGQLGGYTAAAAERLLPQEILTAAPQKVTDAVAFITPSFDAGAPAQTAAVSGGALSAAAASLLRGIGGIGLGSRYPADQSVAMSFITFE